MKGLKMSANVETMFSAVETPWHKLGTVTDSVLTASDALDKAGLDWEVYLKEMYFHNNFGNITEQTKVADKYAVVRQSDTSCLGVVGNKYTPVQNREAFTFMDNIVDSGEAKYETAGALDGGKVIWILMNLKNVEGITNVNGDDIAPYMLLSNSHDGSSALKVTMTPVRVVCQNTLRIALGKRVTQQISIRHTSGITQKVDTARNTLGLAVEYYKGFTETVERMIDKEITDDRFVEIMDSVFPKPSDEEMEKPRVASNYKHKIASVQTNYVSEKHVGTAWGVVNAFNSYEIWQQKIRGGETKRMTRQAKNFILNNQPITNKVKRLAYG